MTSCREETGLGKDKADESRELHVNIKPGDSVGNEDRCVRACNCKLETVAAVLYCYTYLDSLNEEVIERGRSVILLYLT